jgi:hypothetical protein
LPIALESPFVLQRHRCRNNPTILRYNGMSGLEITGIVLGAAIVVVLLVNAKDLARYIHISTM